MSEKTKRKIRVNGNKYHIVGEECTNYRRVSVYDDSLHLHYKNKNDIVYRKKRKCLWFNLGHFLFDPPPLEEMMKDAFNEAVCEFEHKQDEEEQFEERVDNRLDAVKEAHEEH